MALIGEKGKIFVVLLLLWCAYIVIGIFVFTAVEGNLRPEYAGKDEDGNKSRTDGDYYERRWSYGNSFWFVIVLLTTIGYGDFTPVTLLGKVLCIVYAIFGIPITILLLRLIGQYMLRGQRCLITALEARCLGRNGPPSRLNEKCFALGITFLLLLLFGGAAAQMTAEGWSYGDSLYFYVISTTTVGFGDLVPNNKYIAVPFILLVLTAVSNILHAAASMALVKRMTVGSKDEEEETAEKTAAKV